MEERPWTSERNINAMVRSIKSGLERLPRRIIMEGAHGTGKSTLGKELARMLDLPFYDEIARRVLAHYHTDASYSNLDARQIAQVQRVIMGEHSRVIRDARGFSAIIDRGPVSVLAYSLSKLAHTEDTVIQDILDVQRRIVESHADVPCQLYILIPPMFGLDADGVREPQPAKQHMVHYLIDGMLQTHEYPYNRLYLENFQHRLEESLEIIDAFVS